MSESLVRITLIVSSLLLLTISGLYVRDNSRLQFCRPLTESEIRGVWGGAIEDTCCETIPTCQEFGIYCAFLSGSQLECSEAVQITPYTENNNKACFQIGNCPGIECTDAGWHECAQVFVCSWDYMEAFCDWSYLLYYYAPESCSDTSM